VRRSPILYDLSRRCGLESRSTEKESINAFLLSRDARLAEPWIRFHGYTVLHPPRTEPVRQLSCICMSGASEKDFYRRVQRFCIIRPRCQTRNKVEQLCRSNFVAPQICRRHAEHTECSKNRIQPDGVRGEITEKYFSGNYYVKFGHFLGKNHVKFWNFVNFSGKYYKNSGILLIFRARIM